MDTDVAVTQRFLPVEHLLDLLCLACDNGYRQDMHSSAVLQTCKTVHDGLMPRLVDLPIPVDDYIQRDRLRLGYNGQPATRLRIACLTGNVARVRTLLALGADPCGIALKQGDRTIGRVPAAGVHGSAATQQGVSPSSASSFAPRPAGWLPSPCGRVHDPLPDGHRSLLLGLVEGVEMHKPYAITAVETTMLLLASGVGLGCTADEAGRVLVQASRKPMWWMPLLQWAVDSTREGWTTFVQPVRADVSCYAAPAYLLRELHRMVREKVGGDSRVPVRLCWRSYHVSCHELEPGPRTRALNDIETLMAMFVRWMETQSCLASGLGKDDCPVFFGLSELTGHFQALVESGDVPPLSEVFPGSHEVMTRMMYVALSHCSLDFLRGTWSRRLSPTVSYELPVLLWVALTDNPDLLELVLDRLEDARELQYEPPGSTMDHDEAAQVQQPQAQARAELLSLLNRRWVIERSLGPVQYCLFLPQKHMKVLVEYAHELDRVRGSSEAGGAGGGAGAHAQAEPQAGAAPSLTIIDMCSALHSHVYRAHYVLMDRQRRLEATS